MNFGALKLLIFVFLINGCAISRINLSNPISDRHNSYLKLLHKYGMVDRDTIVFLQPLNCLKCQPEVLSALIDIRTAKIIQSVNDSCSSYHETQQCFFYNNEEIMDLGLTKFYSELIIMTSDSTFIIKELYN